MGYVSRSLPKLTDVGVSRRVGGSGGEKWRAVNAIRLAGRGTADNNCDEVNQRESTDLVMALSGEPDGRNGSRHVLRQFSRPSGGLRELGCPCHASRSAEHLDFCRCVY